MPGFEWINKDEQQAVAKIFDGGVLFAHGFENLRKNFRKRNLNQHVLNTSDVNML